jgi:hypothetical protein
MTYAMTERLEWRRWVTPQPLREKPIHRWYVFPHSYTDDLVTALIDEWGLGSKDRLLDPFVGAGTTLVAAQKRGVPATGYDISPLAVMAAKVKTTAYDCGAVEKSWRKLKPSLAQKHLFSPSRRGLHLEAYPDLVHKAFSDAILAALHRVRSAIARLDSSEEERDFFKLALLAVLPKFSRAVATGGWLKLVEPAHGVDDVPSLYGQQVELMLADLLAQSKRRIKVTARVADARHLPDKANTYTGVITSPPYPNRHDYTRVFGVELMFAFMDWEALRNLRYQSFHSHPEARPTRPEATGYTQPSGLGELCEQVNSKAGDHRVASMLTGYFLDLFLVLKEIRRVCATQSRIGLVLGNAQYCGLAVPVDEWCAEVGEQVGFRCLEVRAVRYRGNSAQQMHSHGRRPSRESLIVFMPISGLPRDQ